MISRKRNIDTSSTQSVEEPTETSEKDSEGTLIQEKYDQIERGMTYPEIVEIIGSEGELVVGPDPYKVRQVRKTQFYWLDAEPHLKGVKFTFVDGRLTSK